MTARWTMKDLGPYMIHVLERTSGNQPTVVNWEITTACELNCPHCFCERPGDQPTTEECHYILRELADRGTMMLTLTGGDPLLRPDFAELYVAARRLGLLVILFSSMTSVSSEALSVLRRYPPQRIEATLYGATQGTFDKVTATPGGFDRFLHGLGMLRQAGLPVVLKSLVTVDNYHEVHAMRAFAAEHTGTKLWRHDASIHPRVDGNRSPLRFRVTVEQAARLEAEFSERKRAAERFTEHATLQADTARKTKLLTCGGGRFHFHLSGRGILSICSGLRDLGAAVVPDFELGWRRLTEEVIPELREMEYPPGHECIECAHRPYCIGCPAKNRSECGDWFNVEPFRCALTRAMASSARPFAGVEGG